MKIGRKDDNEPSGMRPPATGAENDAGGERPPSASFDWSKVKGAGAPSASDAAPVKKERAPKKSASKDDDKKFVWPLNRNENYLAGGITVLFLAIIYFAFLRGDPTQSAATITTLQLQQMGQEAAKEMKDNLARMEKEFGPNHPEVQQQREMMKQLKIAP